MARPYRRVYEFRHTMGSLSQNVADVKTSVFPHQFEHLQEWSRFLARGNKKSSI